VSDDLRLGELGAGAAESSSAQSVGHLGAREVVVRQVRRHGVRPATSRRSASSGRQRFDEPVDVCGSTALRDPRRAAHRRAPRSRGPSALAGDEPRRSPRRSNHVLRIPSGPLMANSLNVVCSGNTGSKPPLRPRRPFRILGEAHAGPPPPRAGPAVRATRRLHETSEGEQRLIRRDVRRRLLAADVAARGVWRVNT